VPQGGRFFDAGFVARSLQIHADILTLMYKGNSGKGYNQCQECRECQGCQVYATYTSRRRNHSAATPRLRAASATVDRPGSEMIATAHGRLGPDINEPLTVEPFNPYSPVSLLSAVPTYKFCALRAGVRPHVSARAIPQIFIVVFTVCSTLDCF
jgi:hypothetical protein